MKEWEMMPYYYKNKLYFIYSIEKLIKNFHAPLHLYQIFFPNICHKMNNTNMFSLCMCRSHIQKKTFSFN